MKDATYLKRIQIKIDEDGAGLFHATSPDLEGFLVSERTMEALDAEIPKAIQAMYAENEMRVSAMRAEDFASKH